MNTRADPPVPPFFRRWVLATLAGWILGVVVVIPLTGLGEVVGIGDSVPLGLGMGWSVGFAQWLVGRKWFGVTSRWMWASALGMGAPFILTNPLRARVGERWSVVITAFIGALLVSLWQRAVLRPHSAKANWWIPASLGGWGLAVCIPAAVVSGHRHPFMAIGAIAFGGVALGVVTAAALVWVLRPRWFGRDSAG